MLLNDITEPCLSYKSVKLGRGIQFSLPHRSGGLFRECHREKLDLQCGFIVAAMSLCFTDFRLKGNHANLIIHRVPKSLESFSQMVINLYFELIKLGT